MKWVCCSQVCVHGFFFSFFCIVFFFCYEKCRPVPYLASIAGLRLH